MAWRSKRQCDVRVACAEAAWCARGVTVVCPWRARVAFADVTCARGVRCGFGGSTKATFLGDWCV